jgi:ABC-type multidrug transport system fused ATPase/permease subunit
MLITIGSVSVVAMMFHSFSKWRIEKWGTERQFQEGIKLQQMSETFGGIKEVIMTGQVGYFQGLFCSNVRQLAHLNRKFTTILGIPRLYLELLAVVGLAALMLSKLLLGTPPESLLPSLALFGGGAFRLMPAANRIMFALQSLKMGTPIIEVLQSNLTSLQPMELQCNKTTPLQLRRSIRFEDVWYSYPGTEKSAIKGLNLEIVKGSQVGLVGTTGAGKSTVIDILLGLLRPTDGRVTVDGVDIFSNLRGWRESVGYVPQTIYLLDASIRANIAFGISEEGIDDERISRALDLARLSEFVDELPNGVNESVGERGVKLSGGQRQRIGIARALYRNPSIVVFDEATSALDVETENEIMKSLESLRADRTLLIVTHRQSALKGCDQLVTIDDGVVSSLRG